MSYDFSGGGWFTGVGASGYNLPLTIGNFFKFKTVHTVNDHLLSFSQDTNTNNNSIYLATGNADDEYRIITRGAAGADVAEYLSSATEYDDVWTGIVGVVTSTTLRDVYVEVIGNTATNTTSRDPGTTMDSVCIGNRIDDGNQFPHFLAECFVYDGVMSDADITSFLGGKKATSLVGAANLIGYYSLDSNDDSPVNESDGDGPTLALTGTAVFAATHPTITSDLSIPIAMHHYQHNLGH